MGGGVWNGRGYLEKNSTAMTKRVEFVKIVVIDLIDMSGVKSITHKWPLSYSML